MHGIYNEEDKNALQQYAIGNMAIMYRKWIVPNIQKRFGKKSYNFDLETETEGYYRTGFRFAKMLVENARSLEKLSVKATLGKLNENEKSNLRRMTTDFFQFMIIAASAAVVEAIVKGGVPDDDDDRNKLLDFIDYQLVRQRAELGALTPFSFLTGKTNMLTEALTILGEPVTGMTVWNRYLSFPQLLLPSTYSDEKRLTSGRYKGKTRAHKIIWENIFFSRTMYGNFHPEEKVKFYRNMNVN